MINAIKKYIILNAMSLCISIFSHSFFSSSVIFSKSGGVVPSSGLTTFLSVEAEEAFFFVAAREATRVSTGVTFFGSSTWKKSSLTLRVSGLTYLSTILSLLFFLVISSISPVSVFMFQSKSGYLASS